jgi:hypothetical protein
MKQYVTVGLGVLVGAALFETALIPGLLIGGVAVLAPRYLPKGTLPKLRRRVETLAEKRCIGNPPARRRRHRNSNRWSEALKTSCPNSPSARRSPRPSPSGSS